jgi:hypothetical protein
MTRRLFLRPHLTVLEDRLTPATVVWTDAGGDGLWTNPQNWFNTETQAAALPAPGDDVVFDTGVAAVPGGGSNADAILPAGSLETVATLTVGPGYAPSGPGTGHVVLLSDTTVVNVSLSGLGSLSLPPGNFTVRGNWARSPGFGFDPDGGTVTFIKGGAQTLDSGGLGGAFNNLKADDLVIVLPGVGPPMQRSPTTLRVVNNPLQVLGTLSGSADLDTNGQTVMAGSADMTAGTLTATLNGPLPGTTAVLTSAGVVKPGGLSVNLGYMPAVGTVIHLIHAAGGVSGTFTKGSFSIPEGTIVTASNGQPMRLHYSATDVMLTVVTPPGSIFAVGADAGGGPQVNVYEADGTLLFAFDAYNPAFTGGVRVATGDVTGDGVPDIITAAGPGGGPHVKVFDGITGQEVRSFFAYDAGFTGGVFVAAGDLNGDGIADIITGAGAGGGPHVKAFDGATGQVLQSFFAYDPSFLGGVTVAAGDMNGDGKDDIVTGAGPGGGPHVKEFDGRTGALIGQFFAYDPGFTGGVFVGTIRQLPNYADADEIVTGPGAGGGPDVRIFYPFRTKPSGQAVGGQLFEFLAYGPDFTGGVRVSGALTGPNNPGNGVTFSAGDLVTSPGPGGGAGVRVFPLGGDVPTLDFAPFSGFPGGEFVG